ncbi:MAG: DnaJ domain-containing protein [Polyangiales bacterium]
MHARLGATHYELLGVPTDCDRAQLRQAYFERVKRFHPDVFEGYELWGRGPLVEAIHAALTAAFTVLCDDHLRRAYDRSLGLRVTASVPMPDPAKTTGVRRAPVVPGNDRAAVLPPAPPSAPPSARPASPVPPPRVPTPPPRFAAHYAVEDVRGSAPTRVPEAAPTSVPPPRPSPSVPPPSMPSMPSMPAVSSVTSTVPAPQGPSAQTRRDRLAELLERVTMAEFEHDRAEVIALLRRARELAPDDEQVKARLARAESDASALHYARMSNAARIHEKDGRWDYAVEAWLRAAAASPAELDPLLGVARASCEGNIDLRRAAEYARRATVLAPMSAEAFAQLARVFLTAERPASAKGALTRALELDPSHALAGALMRQLGRR